jgi:uncharacterized RDD family membrane protein YckC
MNFGGRNVNTSNTKNSILATYNPAGFWIRFGAMFIDTLILVVISLVSKSIFYSIAGQANGSVIASIFDILFYFFYNFSFWILLSATPGKLLLGLKIIDNLSGDAPISPVRAILRYIGYIPSSIIFCLGFIWVAFNENKMGWHDYIAGTQVVYK